MTQRLFLIASIAAAMTLTSCRQDSTQNRTDNQGSSQPPAHTEQASSRRPSATEEFDLRTKCAALGAKIMEDNLVGINLAQDQVSRYNPDTNRCYVKLEVHTADLSVPQEKFIRHIYLFDGQTKDLLLTATSEGNRKSGAIFSDGLRKFVHDPYSFDEVEGLIERFVAEDRRP